jgi:hypothetical protein
MITKTAYEEHFRTHQFRRPDGKGWLNEAETVASCTVTVTGSDSALVVSSVAPYNNTMVSYQLSGGTSGVIYRLSIKVITSNGQRFEDFVEVAIR